MPAGRLLGDPYSWLCKTIVYYHPTGYTPSASRSFGSSLREGAKAASPQREAKSLPYGWRCENQGGGVSCSKYI